MALRSCLRSPVFPTVSCEELSPSMTRLNLGCLSSEPFYPLPTVDPTLARPTFPVRTEGPTSRKCVDGAGVVGGTTGVPILLVSTSLHLVKGGVFRHEFDSWFAFPYYFYKRL